MQKAVSIKNWQDGLIPLDETPIRFDRLLARAKVMKQVLLRLQLAATRNTPVLLLGESGTGKDLVAHSIHLRSRRKDGPFVTLNASAVPEDLIAAELFGYEQGVAAGPQRKVSGKLALAARGTLFVDNVENLDLSTQASLHQAMATQEYSPIGSPAIKKADVRIVASSSADLPALVKQGHFRQDLYQRLSAFALTLPPLRLRTGAVPVLAEAFLYEVNEAYNLQVSGLSPAALERLEAYPWPGNVRELKNVIQRGVLLAREGELGLAHLPERLHEESQGTGGSIGLAPGRKLAELEKQYLLSTLAHCRGNKTKAAAMLGISRKGLHEKLARFKV